MSETIDDIVEVTVLGLKLVELTTQHILFTHFDECDFPQALNKAGN